MLRNIKLVLEYDGTDYAGFQRQKQENTIQQILEVALTKICQEEISIVGAGRTDAGVHALAQVCHFKMRSSIPYTNLLKGLNALLPKDIVVHDIKEMPLDFNARYSAKARAYAYFILNKPTPSALFHRYLHWVPFSLDHQGMKQACQCLIGEQDFSSFCSAASNRKNMSTHIKKARFFRGTDFLHLPFSHLEGVSTFYIEAQSFLYNMVRIILGTLLEIGKGKRTVQSLERVLKGRDRKLAGPTASPKGLFLVRVDYPKEFQ